MAAAARKGAVRAVDLVPSAFAEEDEDAGAGTLEFDVGHMVAFDAATVTGRELGPHGPVREAALRKEATVRAQSLVAQLWQLPVRKTDVGPMVRPRPCAALTRAAAVVGCHAASAPLAPAPPRHTCSVKCMGGMRVSFVGCALLTPSCGFACRPRCRRR